MKRIHQLNLVIALLFLLTAMQVRARQRGNFFEAGDRVCFVGNSITNAGEFHRNLLLFHLTRFPDIPVTVYNCGVSGDDTERVLRRLEDDILINKPTKVVIMLGMNDVRRSLYEPQLEVTPTLLKQREEALHLYKKNYQQIVNELLSRKIKVILQKPTIYDQTAELSTISCWGVNDALKQCADFIQHIADRHKLQCIDYWTILNEMNQELQKKEPTATLISKDRVHPQSTGHFIMFNQYLKTAKAPEYVSKMIIDTNLRTSSSKSENCTISNLHNKKNEISWTVRENALPFPVSDAQKEGDAMLKFRDNFNRQHLQVNKLNQGFYTLWIDEVQIGSFSDEVLAGGINLANYPSTPQYQQALEVRRVLNELWKLESGLRGLKFIEGNYHFKNAPDKQNPQAMKAHLYPIFDKQYPSNSSFFKSQLDNYFIIKPLEETYKQKSDSLRQVAKMAAQPREHIFRLTTNAISASLGNAFTTPAYIEEGYWSWCGSVVKGDDNLYHMYVSRFPKSLPFHPGWMVASEVIHAVSAKPQGPYQFSDISLPPRGAQYWDGRMTHNPSIQKHNGKYYLFYIGSTHPFEEPTYDELTLSSKWCIVARSNKRIGIAVADSPYGPWTRFEKPILDTKANTFYSYLTSNPAPSVQKDGSVYMIFKGRGHKDHTFTHMSLGVAFAPSVLGEYKVLNNDQPIFNVNTQGEAEDPFLWTDNDGFHMIFKDQVGAYTGEKGGGVLAHSSDAVKWKIDQSPKAYSRTLKFDNGSTGTQGQLERPFILFENEKPAYLFFATMNGPGGFNNATKSWNIAFSFKK